MSYLDRQYISKTGDDFTEYVHTEEDVAKFEEMCSYERRIVGVPVHDCIHDIVKALNLGRELKGSKARVAYIGIVRDPKLN